MAKQPQNTVTKKASSKDKALEVRVPAKGAGPPWVRVGVLSAAGLVLGMAWPTLAGLRVGPQVPGAKTAAPVVEAPAAPVAAPKASAGSTVVEGDEAKRSNEQRVVVGEGKIIRCYKGKDSLKGEACGKLNVDRVFVPRLQELKRCSSAVGLAGEMTMGFDIDFKKKSIHVVKGKSDLPASTIQGIIVCTADFIADVSAEKIPHKYTKYRVFYSLNFYPPGTAPPGEGNKTAGPDDVDRSKAMAAVEWDRALIRSEPKTGKVVMRLVRGTMVKIVGRRKDWYHVKVREKEGWVYRGALGR